jgi:uncharacterized damage-inducible protein DinB
MQNRIIISRPNASEYSPSLEHYISLVPGSDLLSYFDSQTESVASIAQSLPEEKLLYRYAEGKWSIKDIMNHVIDCERIYGYRALCIARADKTELPGFEENDYAKEANADIRNIESIINEYKTVRAATIELFNSFDQNQLNRVGIANGSPRSVRAAAYITAGHELHHVNVIKERYLKV